MHMWISCQSSGPCGALWRPRATILLHYPPLAAQDLASSTALPGLRVSTFVSKSRAWLSSWTCGKKLLGLNSWLATQACSRLLMLFYLHFDYVDRDYSCSHEPCKAHEGWAWGFPTSTYLMTYSYENVCWVFDPNMLLPVFYNCNYLGYLKFLCAVWYCTFKASTDPPSTSALLKLPPGSAADIFVSIV